MTTPKAPPRRYATISVRPETHAAFVALARPRETLDELLRRIIESHLAWPQGRSLEH